MVFSALFLTGSALSISAQNWQWFTGAGVVTKFALGIAQTTLIVYLAEIAPFQLRGTGMAAYQLFLAGGQLIGAIATQIQIKVDPNAWRPLLASEFVITGVGYIRVGSDADHCSCSFSCSPSSRSLPSFTSGAEMKRRLNSA